MQEVLCTVPLSYLIDLNGLISLCCAVLCCAVLCCAVSRFFIFQVFATFIYNFIAGSALGQIQAMIDDPTGTIVNLLGVAAAQQASFFMSFIMLRVSGGI